MPANRYRRCLLATCCLPWSEGFEFEEEIFQRSVRTLIQGGIRDLYIFGTAGEGYAVTETQFDHVTRFFLDETRGEGVQGMIGLISPSLPTIIERIERALGMGARWFQLSLPNWGTLRDSEVDHFFRETCGRFPEAGFLHYNLQRSGRLLNGSDYARLAAAHPNLVATKNSTTDEARLRDLFSEAPQLRHFITEAGFAKAAVMGECGFLMSYTSTRLDRALEYFRAGCEIDRERLDAIAGEFDGLVATLRETVGDTAHMDGAFDKLFCRVHDPEFPLRLLPPYDAVNEERFDLYLRGLRENHPQWLP